MEESESGQVSHFWKSIYEQEKLAVRMNEIAALEDGYTFHSPDYGSVKLTATRATKLGENFMSLTFYATAHLADGVQHKAFVKILPDNPFLCAAAMEQNLYEREISSYCHYFPLLRQIRTEAGLSSTDIPLNVPEIYYSILDQQGNEDGGNVTVLVMEELKSQGFQMADVKVGCTVEQVRLTLSTLANYHALSIMLLRKYKNPDGSYSLPEKLQYALKPVLFNESLPSMVSQKLPIVAEMIRHFNHEEAAIWLESQLENVKEAMGVEDISRCGPLACILHSDCWNNNMLYRHKEDGSEAIAMRLIDWQILSPGRPGKDVAHFLFTSTKSELRRESGPQLLDHYVTTLTSALKKLGAHGSDFDRGYIMAELKKQFLYGMFTGVMVLEAVLDETLVKKMGEWGEDQKKVGAAGDEIFKDVNIMTLDTLLSNEELCNRIVDMVEEIKEIIQLTEQASSTFAS